MVGTPFLRSQYGIEALGIEVAVVDVPAGFRQRCDGGDVQGGDVAFRAGVSVDDEGAGHQSFPAEPVESADPPGGVVTAK